MVQVVKMTDEEKFEMYMKVPHEELVRMKIESERLNDIWNEPKCYSTQPQFTLTPEEVEELKEFLEEEIQALDLSVQFLMTTEDFESCKHNSEAIEKRNKWLNRIKQWQDETTQTQKDKP